MAANLTAFMPSASLVMTCSAGRFCAFSACATSVRPPGPGSCLSNTGLYQAIECGKELSRLDIGGSNALDSAVAQALVAALSKNLASFDVVIVN